MKRKEWGFVGDWDQRMTFDGMLDNGRRFVDRKTHIGYVSLTTAIAVEQYLSLSLQKKKIEKFTWTGTTVVKQEQTDGAGEALEKGD